MGARRRTPWRENLEAAAGAILLAVMFKYFVLEFYRIPSGSMQPTLYGAEAPLELYDRVVADKLSYHVRDPERFEVVIFRYPLDRSKNFVKRVVGLPGEQLRIQGGDVWVQPEGAAAPSGCTHTSPPWMRSCSPGRPTTRLTKFFERSSG